MKLKKMKDIEEIFDFNVDRLENKKRMKIYY